MALTCDVQFCGSVLAAANLTAKYFIGMDGNVCGASAKALGVSLYDCDSGEMASIVKCGEALVLSGGAVSVGDPVAADSAGKAVSVAALSATNALSGALTAGTLAIAAHTVSGAPAAGTLAVTVDAGVTPVTSSAANGAICTVAGAPTAGTLAVDAHALSGVPAVGTLAVASTFAGGRLPVITNGWALDAASGANETIRVRLA